MKNSISTFIRIVSQQFNAYTEWHGYSSFYYFNPQRLCKVFIKSFMIEVLKIGEVRVFPRLYDTTTVHLAVCLKSSLLIRGTG